ncbi:MAG TPA: hypothetical protein VME42_15130 [Steroidobacteraceae bacterium]|nr:hypothetical protein [Steroidobacteraceae bacterium]
MFQRYMRPHRTWPLLAALLLVALLPLRGYCASCSGHHAHCGDTAISGHACADCCLTGVAATAPCWALPRRPAASAFTALPWPVLTLSLDRLDRPPRS